MTITLKKVLGLFTPSERRKSILMLAMVILMALAETGGVISIVPFLSVLTRPGIVEQNEVLAWLWQRFGFTDQRRFIVALGLASMTMVVGSAVFKTVTLHALNRFVQFLRHSISTRLLARYLGQPYEFFLDTNSSILSRNVLAEVDLLSGQLLLPLTQLIAHGAVVLAMVSLVFWYNPITAIGIVLVLGLLYGAVYGLVRKRLARISDERIIANGQRYKACNEALQGIKDVKIAQAQAVYENQYAQGSRVLARHQATSDTLAQAPLYLVEATGYSLLIVLALLLMTQSSDLGRVLPALGLYGFAAYRMLPAAQVMYRGFSKLKYSSASLDALHRDLQLPLLANQPAIEPVCLQNEIRLENIRFAYPSAPDKPVLDGFSLVLPAGTSLGIAGPSGAGKSTLMDILLGLLEPQAGTFSVDGVPITSENVQSWQRSVGYVPQQIYLADASVAENIAFGLPNDKINWHAVERAARMAQIHEFVTSELSHGYDTKIGDRGIRLSGGQRQRIGIARALYRDPSILFMDEATSALDTKTEEAITEAIDSLSGSKTVIVIAHRTASLRLCSQTLQFP